MSPDEEEESEEDAPEAQDAPVAEPAAPLEQPGAAAEQPSAGAEAPVAEAEQPGMAPERPSAGAEAPVPEAGQPGTGAPAGSATPPPATSVMAGRPPAPPAPPAPSGGSPERRGSGPPERGGRHFGRRKFCTFCVDKATSVDYKDPSKLRRFVSDRGRIEGRRRTGVCAKHQRWLAVALKRARHLALLPYTPEHIRSSGAFPSRR